MANANKMFPIGTSVRTTQGVRREGTVVKPFPASEANDGSYGEVGRDAVYVEWNDGTKGFWYKWHLVSVSIPVVA